MTSHYFHSNLSMDMSIERIMQHNLLTCRPDTSIYEATNLMAQRQCSSIVIVEENHAIGIWTEHDSLGLDLNDPTVLFKPIKEVMSYPVMTLPNHTKIDEVKEWLHQHNLRHVLITDEDIKPVGIVSITDLSLKQRFEVYLKVKTIQEVMDPNPLTVSETLSLSQLTQLMRQQKQELALIRDTNNSNNNDGIITERDVIKYIAKNDIHSPIHSLATRPVYTLSSTDSLWKARNTFLDKKIRHLIIKDQDKVVGSLSLKQILYGFESKSKEDVVEIFESYHKNNYSFNLDINLTKQVINNSLESILITDPNNIIQFVNPAFTHTTGYHPEEVIGRKVNILSSGRHELDFYKKMWAKIKKQGFWKGEIWNRKKNGQLFLELLKITAIYGTNKEIINYVATFSDITYIRENERKIERLAFYDPLTNLPNRRLFEDQITQAIKASRRLNKKLAVIYLDLDHFKSINDTLGHEAGDELLVALTHRIKRLLKASDILARLGGDEFVILLHDISKIEDVELICERISKRLNEAVTIKGHTLRVGCSMGVSLFPDHAKEAKKLLRNADIAMYRAKNNGRNTYTFYQPAMQLPHSRFLELNVAFREAIETKEGLFFVFQPIVDFEGKLAYIETLARWNHPELGAIPPLEFIQLAERTGLIKDFSVISCELLTKQINSWIKNQKTLVPLTVNISALQFWDNHFIENFLNCLEKQQIPSHLINIELTESVILNHHQQAIQKLNTLYEHGLKIFIDDFGTGYSSLSYLHQLPISAIKIDQQFINDMISNKSSRAILAAVASLAKELNILTIAEGVETKQQLEALKHYEINLIQGYLIDKPLTADALEKKWLLP